MSSHFSRRRFLHLAGAATAAAAIEGCGPAGPRGASLGRRSPRRKGNRVLRIAHLTDAHVTPDKGAPEGIAACLRHLNALEDRPDVIFTGGDCVMDSLNAPEQSVRDQWAVWTGAFERLGAIPHYPCLGNHDIWGWNKESSHTTGSEPLYGKNWARKVFGVDRLYRSFDLAGWHFIFIDSMVYDGGTSYYAALDEDQFAWLQNDLAATPSDTPILVLSHIPILSACVFYDGDNAKADWVVPRAWMHIDSARVNELFNGYPNIRLCLSGHLHLYERVLYNGVTYICDGAVCGGWWDGPYKQCNPGYGLIDLYSDGSFDNEYVEYGWIPLKDRKPKAAASLSTERISIG